MKILEPEIGEELDLSPETVKRYDEAVKKCEELMIKLEKEGRSELTLEEEEICSKIDETKSSLWYIIGGGCSWYCGGGPKEITASSYLEGQGENTYIPENAHDLNYKNAWVEGVPGYGIGEYLTYIFPPESGRVTKVIVVNGYVKSQSAWENNSRVKQLKMYVDNKPFAILNLKDVIAHQTFTVDPIGYSDREDFEKLRTMPEWTIKFEILDVYKGIKYDDVVITEIFFDGLDVHCFAKGTKISLPNGKYKNIEDLLIGDKIISYDKTIDDFIITTIEDIESVRHHSLVKYTFENGAEITATQDHPFLLKDKGWASLKPENSKQYKGFDIISLLEINDIFWFSNNDKELTALKLINIDLIPDEQETYTISKTSLGDNFIANGFIVGIEELRNLNLVSTIPTSE